MLRFLPFQNQPVNQLGRVLGNPFANHRASEKQHSGGTPFRWTGKK